MTNTNKILAQLRVLTQLTQTEAQVAQIRVGQARTDAVRRELQENGRNAVARTEALQDALRELGGVPDVVTPAVGRVTGFAKAAFEQAEALDEALLQDLSLEHQLLDRARYLKVLARTAELPKVGKLADRLVEAHTATVEWLTVVLAEEALGGPAALVATPFQRVTAGATRVAQLPARFAAERVNRTVDTVQQSTEQTRQTLTSLAGKAAQMRGAVRESLTVGRNAGLERAEKVARRNGDTDTAKAVHESRRDLGALSAAELPVKKYDTLNQTETIKAVKALDRAEDVRTVLAYEEANAARSSVVSALQTRLAGIAKQTVGIAD
jgi:hypothetical protein